MKKLLASPPGITNTTKTLYSLPQTVLRRAPQLHSRYHQALYVLFACCFARSRCHPNSFWKTALPSPSMTSPWHAIIRVKSQLLILAVDCANPVRSLAPNAYQIARRCQIALPCVLVNVPKSFVKGPLVASTSDLLYCSVAGRLKRRSAVRSERVGL